MTPRSAIFPRKETFAVYQEQHRNLDKVLGSIQKKYRKHHIPLKDPEAVFTNVSATVQLLNKSPDTVFNLLENCYRFATIKDQDLYMQFKNSLQAYADHFFAYFYESKRSANSKQIDFQSQDLPELLDYAKLFSWLNTVAKVSKRKFTSLKKNNNAQDLSDSLQMEEINEIANDLLNRLKLTLKPLIQAIKAPLLKFTEQEICASQDNESLALFSKMFKKVLKMCGLNQAEIEHLTNDIIKPRKVQISPEAEQSFDDFMQAFLTSSQDEEFSPLIGRFEAIWNQATAQKQREFKYLFSYRNNSHSERPLILELLRKSQISQNLKLEMLKSLEKKGIDLHCTDRNNKNALHYLNPAELDVARFFLNRELSFENSFATHDEPSLSPWESIGNYHLSSGAQSADFRCLKDLLESAEESNIQLSPQIKQSKTWQAC